jgi:uncharacterized protein (UPF0305 family)
VLKIKHSKLFLILKTEIEKYQSIITSNQRLVDLKANSINDTISLYNLENFNEIMNFSFAGSDHEVDEEILDEFTECISQYFNRYAPDDEDFKEFIKIISIYLTFIAKKPLHPPGIIFSNGATVFKQNNSYYCTGKDVFINDEFSLCKYCVCKFTKYIDSIS